MNYRGLKIFLLGLLMIVLSGCGNKLTKEELLEVNAQEFMYVGEYLEIKLPVEFDGLNLSNNVWNNSNDIAAFFEEPGKLYGSEDGDTIVTVKNGKVLFTIKVEVVDKVKAEKDIYEIMTYLRENMGTVGEQQFEIVTSMDGYDFKVAYVSSEPDELSLDGTFTRGLIDKYVTIDATLFYKGLTKKFPISVKIEKIPASLQKQTIEAFLKEEIEDIIVKETGKLPAYFEEYQTRVKWRASFPGVVDSNYNIHKAYSATTVKLYALYDIAGEENEMVINYKSVGISESEKKEYMDKVFKDLIPLEAGRWLNLAYGNKVDIIQDYIYPDAVTQLRPGVNKKGEEMPGGPQYVVIHDTGMTNVGDDADGLNEFIHNNANTPGGRVASWHFSIDDTKAYQHVPTNEIAWHAGDGGNKFGYSAYSEKYRTTLIGGGNQNGIGIETCINPGNDYEYTLKRTAKLTADLLYQYGLQLDRIKQHFNFSGKNCPNVIRSTNGLWDTFLRDVEIEYFLLVIGNDAKLEWEVSHPQIVKSSGLVVSPIDDTLVNLTLKVTIGEGQYVYNYEVMVKGYPIEEKLLKVYYDLAINIIPLRASADINLPVINELYKAAIVWKSSDPTVLSETGKYIKPDQEKNVTLTATISINGEELVRTFSVSVK
jgi:N-acetylmuramoyl-L-alanine amidase CwlA